MTRGQKAGYLFSEWTVGWLIFYALLVFAIFGMSEGVFIAFGISAAVFLLMFGPVALAKWRAIRKSNARTSDAALMARVGKMG